jgi:hypothetical protein
LPSETITLRDSGGVVTVKLHGDDNVVLLLRDDADDKDPLVYGFPTWQDWQQFVKACLRFDEAASRRPTPEVTA